MQKMIKGVTFDNQNVTSKIDGGFYNRIFTNDGIVRGCSMSVTTNTLTIQPGLMIIAGRLIWIDSATTLTLDNPINNGYAALVLTIDLSQTASITEFEQIGTDFVYSATTVFPELTKGNINGEGGDTIYQAQIAVVSLAGGNIANIISTIGNVKLNADTLEGSPKSYFTNLINIAQTASETAQAMITAPTLYCRARRTTEYNLGAGANVVFMYNGIADNVGGFMSDDYKIVVPQDGIYEATFQGEMRNITGGGYTIYLRAGDGSIAQQNALPDSIYGGGWRTVCCSLLARLKKGQKIWAEYTASAGTTGQLVQGNSDTAEIRVCRIGNL